MLSAPPYGMDRHAGEPYMAIWTGSDGWDHASFHPAAKNAMRHPTPGTAIYRLDSERWVHVRTWTPDIGWH